MRIEAMGIIFVAITLVGCTVVRTPQLYPNNDAARALGPLTATITGHGSGNGTISMSLPNGEILQGQYSIALGGSTNFGSLYGSVYGPGGSASGSAFVSGMSISNSGQGMADMMDSKDTTAHCEFMNNNMTGHGNGACELSSGAIYRMQY